MKQNSFYFMRHGEADFASMPHHDDPDVPLTLWGRKQALSMQSIFESLSIKTICVSPLSRAIQTKEIISENTACNFVVIEELQECSGTIWKKMCVIDEKTTFICPTVQEFMNRSLTGIKRSLHQPGPVLIVAHGGIHWALCHLLKVNTQDKLIGNCVLAHFLQDDDQQWHEKIIAHPSIE